MENAGATALPPDESNAAEQAEAKETKASELDWLPERDYSVRPQPSRNEEVVSPALPPPTFSADKPWHVSSFKIEAGKLLVETKDSGGVTGTLEFNCHDLRLIQYISSSDPKNNTRKLYAEVRRASQLLFGQPPNQIVYLGEITKDEFPALERELEKGHLDSVWYTTPRRERMTDLLPRAWGTQPS